MAMLLVDPSNEPDKVAGWAEKWRGYWIEPPDQEQLQGVKSKRFFLQWWTKENWRNPDTDPPDGTVDFLEKVTPGQWITLAKMEPKTIGTHDEAMHFKELCEAPAYPGCIVTVSNTRKVALVG
jgi:hypothetical protein